jgi:polyisoprenoid-binding protein YceI
MTSSQKAQTERQQTAATVFDLDPAHSSAEFSVRHLMISTVTGRFRKVKGTLELDEADPARSRVEAEIDVASLDTGVADRDAHLRSPDFFDVANHPTMTFRSKRVEPKGRDRARVVGDLTIRGVTREVGLDVTRIGTVQDPWGNRRAGFEATATLDRKDFGLNWNMLIEAGGVVVGDAVKVRLDVEAVQRKDAGLVQP